MFSFYFCQGIRFYVYSFCVMLTDILLIMSLPVRDHSSSHLTRHISPCRASSSSSLLSDPSSDTHTPPQNPNLTHLLLSHSVQVVLHSILACRLMIGIREARESSERKRGTIELPRIAGGNIVEVAREPV